MSSDFLTEKDRKRIRDMGLDPDEAEEVEVMGFKFINASGTPISDKFLAAFIEGMLEEGKMYIDDDGKLRAVEGKPDQTLRMDISLDDNLELEDFDITEVSYDDFVKVLGTERKN